MDSHINAALVGGRLLPLPCCCAYRLHGHLNADCNSSCNPALQLSCWYVAGQRTFAALSMLLKSPHITFCGQISDERPLLFAGSGGSAQQPVYEPPGNEHLSASDLQALLHQQQHQQMMGSNPDLLQPGHLEMLLQSAQLQPGSGERMQLHSCKHLQSQAAAKPCPVLSRPFHDPPTIIMYRPEAPAPALFALSPGGPRWPGLPLQILAPVASLNTQAALVEVCQRAVAACSCQQTPGSETGTCPADVGSRGFLTLEL